MWSTNPAGSHSSTFPEDHSWMNQGAGQKGRSGSAACCCALQKGSLQMKRQKSTSHDTLKANYIFCRTSCAKDTRLATFSDSLYVMSSCNYFHCHTRVFDELEGIVFRERRHFIWWFFRHVSKPAEGGGLAVSHQVRHLGAHFRTALERTMERKLVN